jgi:hypothetical protein
MLDIAIGYTPDMSGVRYPVHTEVFDAPIVCVLFANSKFGLVAINRSGGRPWLAAEHLWGLCDFTWECLEAL